MPLDHGGGLRVAGVDIRKRKVVAPHHGGHEGDFDPGLRRCDPIQDAADLAIRTAVVGELEEAAVEQDRDVVPHGFLDIEQVCEVADAVFRR